MCACLDAARFLAHTEIYRCAEEGKDLAQRTRGGQKDGHSPLIALPPPAAPCLPPALPQCLRTLDDSVQASGTVEDVSGGAEQKGGAPSLDATLRTAKAVAKLKRRTNRRLTRKRTAKKVAFGIATKNSGKLNDALGEAEIKNLALVITGVRWPIGRAGLLVRFVGRLVGS